MLGIEFDHTAEFFMLIKTDNSEGETINQAKSRFTELCVEYLQDKKVTKLTEYQPPQLPDYVQNGLEISPGKFFAVHLGKDMSAVLQSFGVKEEVAKSY